MTEHEIHHAGSRYLANDLELLARWVRISLVAGVQAEHYEPSTQAPGVLGLLDDALDVNEVGAPLPTDRDRHAVEAERVSEQRDRHALDVDDGRRGGLFFGTRGARVRDAALVECIEHPGQAEEALVEGMVRHGAARVETHLRDGLRQLRWARRQVRPRCPGPLRGPHGELEVADREVGGGDKRLHALELLVEVR